MSAREPTANWLLKKIHSESNASGGEIIPNAWQPNLFRFVIVTANSQIFSSISFFCR
jgi:hypothetical protein